MCFVGGSYWLEILGLFFGLCVFCLFLLKNTSILEGVLGNLKLRMFTQFIAQYNF